MRNIKNIINWIFLLFILLIFLSLFSVVALSSPGLIIIEKDEYQLNELIRIKLPQVLEDYTLTIRNGIDIFRFLGNSNSEITFIPQKEGVYFIELRDSRTNTFLEMINFTVRQSFQNLNFSKQGSQISTKKKFYFLGEEVQVSIFDNYPDYKMTISSNDQTFKYLGGLPENVTFYPRYFGVYTISLFDGNDAYIESVQFEVVQSAITTLLPGKISKPYVLTPGKTTQLYPRIKNSKGQLLEAEITIDDSLKFSSFSSISREVNEHADTLDFVPNEKIVESIRFNSLNLTNGFELNIEKLPIEKADVPGVMIKDAFAIDPEKIDFANASLTFLAVGVELYKCELWNFTAQVCFGAWEKIMNLTPGKRYNLTITPKDPAYAQSSYNADDCYIEPTALSCTAGELSSIQIDDSNFLSFNRRDNSPIRVSFPNETDLIDQVVECVVHVKAQDSEGNSWTLQFGNYSANQWLTGSSQAISTAEADHTWDCASYFGTQDDEMLYDLFGVRIATSDSGRTASAYIDHVWLEINYSLQDLIYPVWSSPTAFPSSPATFSPAGTYQFNTTWTDNEQIGTVRIQHNLSGTFQDYPVTGNVSSAYYYNYGAIAAGTYVWRTYANDTSGNLNNTLPNQTYTINKASPSISLLLNGSSSNITINETQSINITGILQSGEGSIALYNNGTLINSGSSPLTNITQFGDQGDYNITLISPTTQNYTSSYKALFVFVKDVTPPGNITGLNETLSGESWIFWSWTNPIDADFEHTEVWVNGTFYINTSLEFYNVTSLSPNTTYEINLRPVDTYGNKGDWASDTAKTNTTVDNTPPVISNVSNTTITDSSVNITWDTDESSDSFVFFGTNPGSYTDNKSNPTFDVSHNVFLPGLLPSTTYYYIVNSTDLSGNSNTSTEYSFSTLADQTPPKWSNKQENPSSPAVYSPTGQYQYNTTWTDNGFLAEVIIEHNLNGSKANYTPSGNDSSIYYYNYIPTAAGTYSWMMYANDSEGNINHTNSFTYQILRANSNITLLLNSTDGDFTINESSYANITAYMNTGESYIELYIDGEIVNNGSSPMTNITFFDTPGGYIINLTYPQSQNYSKSSVIHTLTVNDIYPPKVNLTSPASGSIDIDGDMVLWFKVNDTGITSNCSLYLNGTLNKSKIIITEGSNSFTVNDLQNGLYLWNVSCIDTASNQGYSQTWNFTVFINEFFPQIYPVSCSQESGSCNITLINISDSLYQEHGYVDKQDRDDYVYFNFSNPDIAAGSTIHWMNFTHEKYQGFGAGEGFYEMDWLNTSSSTWVTLCQQSSPTTTTPPSYDPVSCDFNTTTGSFPTVSQINNGLQLRARWYYSGGDAADKFYGTNFISIYLKYTEDVTPPTVELTKPGNGDARNKGNVIFNYIPTDNNLFNCTIWGDFNGSWSKNITNTSPLSSITNEFKIYLKEGIYSWNVQCFDVAGNEGWALQNYSVNITNPDIQVLSSYITFSNNTPVEGQNITIFSMIKNIGNVNVTTSFLVSFFDGDPAFGGMQINGNRTIYKLGIDENKTVNVSFIVSHGGPIDIFVIADPPLASNGTVTETYEDNNKASNTLNVPGWFTIYGNFSGDFILGNADNSTQITWNSSNDQAKIYVAETGRDVSWYQLQALARDTSNNPAPDDFEELDASLGMSNYVDSVNNTYTSGGSPKEVGTYNIYSVSISNVPIVNSTITSSFKTGILWDYGDGGSEYNGVQDVVFFTKINPFNPGKFGYYSYELTFPVNLENNLEATYDTVSYYFELI